jgi:hypothetical protein
MCVILMCISILYTHVLNHVKLFTQSEILTLTLILNSSILANHQRRYAKNGLEIPKLLQNRGKHKLNILQR